MKEFLRQANAVNLFTKDNAFMPDLSREVVGLERHDVFFPFDPYLLRESERYVFNVLDLVRQTFQLEYLTNLFSLLFKVYPTTFSVLVHG